MASGRNQESVSAQRAMYCIDTSLSNIGTIGSQRLQVLSFIYSKRVPNRLEAVDGDDGQPQSKHNRSVGIWSHSLVHGSQPTRFHKDRKQPQGLYESRTHVSKHLRG